VLFLDEPTTGLDPAARRQFWALIAGLRAEGTTILLTTHYLDEAAHLADRVAVIARGRLIDVATPDALGRTLRLAVTVRWTDEGGRHEVSTQTPTETVREILVSFPTGEVPEFAVYRPSLEDVYLAMLEHTE
jgi:ABC-2 type transport system ATP-binding protein